MMDGIRKTRSLLLNVSEEEVHRRLVQTVPLGRLATPEEVASMVRYLISDEACYITGEAIGINGGSDGS